LLPSFDLSHANHASKLHEPEAPERLGENVSELSPGLDELDDKLSSIDAVTKEVKLHVDVLAPVVEDWVLGQRNGWLVVQRNGSETSRRCDCSQN
jgi:hypothetical protein